MNGHKLMWAIMSAGWLLAVSFGAIAYNGLNENIDRLHRRHDELNAKFDIFANEQYQRRGAADQRSVEILRRLVDLEEKFYQGRKPSR